MNRLDYDRLSELSTEARVNARRRQNFNFHQELSDPIQRLAIAMEPDTYVRPHRHAQTWELLIALRGRFVVLNFDDRGVVIERAILGQEVSVIETPAARWHAVLSLDTGGAIFEVKHGPYAPFREEDFAPWSPTGGSDNCNPMLRWYRDAQVGLSWADASTVAGRE